MGKMEGRDGAKRFFPLFSIVVIWDLASSMQWAEGHSVAF